MIKIMIVDDMPIFREYLRSAIDWGSYGFEICCEAKNGEEALALCKTHEPDIVLSDINMPYMDGLTLAGQLRALCPETNVVLITGHTEFEYARQAVKLGAADFIVKPFDKEELIVTLLSLQDNIQRSIESANVQKNNLYSKREHDLRQLIYEKHLPKEEAQVTLGDVTIHKDGHYRILAIAVDSQVDALGDFEKAMTWKRSVSTMIENLIDEGESLNSFTDYEGHIIVLIHYGLKPIETLETEDFEPLITLLKDRLSLQVTIGIGTIHSGLVGLRKSFLEAGSALNQRFYSQLGPRVIHFETISKEEKALGFYSQEVNESIISSLSQGLESETMELIEKVYQKTDAECYCAELKHMVYMGLISLLLSYLVKSGHHLENIFPYGFKGSSVLTTGTSDESQRAFIRDAYSSVLVYIQQRQDSKSYKIACEAAAIIKSSYTNPEFSMKELTMALMVNQTYLRSMFKSEMGMTISDFVTKCRMEAAKELLAKGYYKHAHIAEAVGYSDQGYFSKCFKRYYGVSPSEFKL